MILSWGLSDMGSPTALKNSNPFFWGRLAYREYYTNLAFLAVAYKEDL